MRDALGQQREMRREQVRRPKLVPQPYLDDGFPHARVFTFTATACNILRLRRLLAVDRMRTDNRRRP